MSLFCLQVLSERGKEASQNQCPHEWNRSPCGEFAQSFVCFIYRNTYSFNIVFYKKRLAFVITSANCQA